MSAGTKGHGRPRLSKRLAAVVAALALGGGATAVVAGNANAGQEQDRSTRVTTTIDCPDVGDRLTSVPDQARTEVDEGLAELDVQVAEAYRRLAAGEARGGDALLGELQGQRDRTITRVSDAIARSAAARPEELKGLAACRMKEASAQEDDAADDTAADPEAARSLGGKAGPARSDFVPIGKVRPNVRPPRRRPGPPPDPSARGAAATRTATPTPTT